MAKDAWHTPGHSSGDSLRDSPWVNDFYEFMGEHVFDADLSVSVPMLDSLMEPDGRDRSRRRRWRPRRSARAAPSSPPTAPRPATRSSSRPCIAPGREAAARPQLPQVACTTAWCCRARIRSTSTRRSTGSTASTARSRRRRCCSAIEEHPDAEALVLTSCTYDGLRYDLAPIIEAAHAQGHQGDRRRGLVRLRALPPGVPPHRAGGGRRLRDPVARTRCCRPSRRPA